MFRVGPKFSNTAKALFLCHVLFISVRITARNRNSMNGQFKGFLLQARSRNVNGQIMNVGEFRYMNENVRFLCYYMLCTLLIVLIPQGVALHEREGAQKEITSQTD